MPSGSECLGFTGLQASMYFKIVLVVQRKALGKLKSSALRVSMVLLCQMPKVCKINTGRSKDDHDQSSLFSAKCQGTVWLVLKKLHKGFNRLARMRTLPIALPLQKHFSWDLVSGQERWKSSDFCQYSWNDWWEKYLKMYFHKKKKKRIRLPRTQTFILLKRMFLSKVRIGFKILRN